MNRGIPQSVCALLFTVCVAVVSSGARAGVPVNVMMPLWAINPSTQQLNNQTLLRGWLQQLSDDGVHGINVDVWWGVVERDQPKTYVWTAYDTLFDICVDAGLEVQPSMSFHACGSNVGDACAIPLPHWVTAVGRQQPSIYYQDPQLRPYVGYLSSGVDHQPVLQGRTAVQVYRDFMAAFAARYQRYFGSTITQVEVGMGPAGELRYPSYREGLWTFPGVGEFQCSDAFLAAELKAAAAAAGSPAWGLAPPDDAGTYDSAPTASQAPFFAGSGFQPFSSDYGQWFLRWYSQRLIEHGSAVLGAAEQVLQNASQTAWPPVGLAGKVSGVHWLFNTPSHAAEQTAGYKNDQGRGYAPLAALMQQYNATLVFTALELLDASQPASCKCAPQQLVAQVKAACDTIGVPMAGENALPAFDQASYARIEAVANSDSTLLQDFTYLRLGAPLMSSNNLPLFAQFVQKMADLTA